MPVKKTKKKGGGKKQNDFFLAKEKARKNNEASFEYTNKQGIKKSYEKFVMKTGMVAYRSK
tara:strand:+ start:8367 stop:8549 length:183 start_codon:yes stop_codon:yes gene_type:complete